MGKNKGSKGKKANKISPWDNLIMEWDTSPEQVRLQTDSQVSINWPFGDDYADMMSTLDDKYFQVFLDKAWALCKAQAGGMPREAQAAFLSRQRARLDGYKAARAKKR